MMSQLYQKVRWWVIVWLAHRLPDCKETSRLISDSLDRELPLRQRIQIKLHLLICIWCERYQRQLAFLRDAMRCSIERIEDTPPTSPASLSLEARNRLKRALSGKSH
jgi:hypothetical protein